MILHHNTLITTIFQEKSFQNGGQITDFSFRVISIFGKKFETFPKEFFKIIWIILFQGNFMVKSIFPDPKNANSC